jgi:hypothetical protein
VTRVLIALAVVVTTLTSARADSLPDIAQFAQSICGDIPEGSLTRASIQGKVGEHADVFAKLASGGADQTESQAKVTYKGIPFDKLPDKIPTVSMCKIELLKILLPYIKEGQSGRHLFEENYPAATFVTEGLRETPDGFNLLFSIWNNTPKAITLFDISTPELVRVDQEWYLTGPRSTLKLKSNKGTLWEGQTFEIASDHSHSFDLRFDAQTGPDDGKPAIIILVIVRYSQPKGHRGELLSDAVYLYRRGHIKNVLIRDLRMASTIKDLGDEIYVDTLEALSRIVTEHRDFVVGAMEDYYGACLEKLREGIEQIGNVDGAKAISSLGQQLKNILVSESKRPLDSKMLKEKRKTLESLRVLSVEYYGLAFIHLCASEWGFSIRIDKLQLFPSWGDDARKRVRGRGSYN